MNTEGFPANSTLMRKRQGSFNLPRVQERKLKKEERTPSLNLDMVETPMPFAYARPDNIPLTEIETPSDLEESDLPPIAKFLSPDLKVEIPKRKKAQIVELMNPFTNKPISTNYKGIESTPTVDPPADIWKRAQRVNISAFHSSFKSKYMVKIEMFDQSAQLIGTLETEMHHNPGHYCFFCLDYCPESYNVKKGIKISSISPYCNCLSKNIDDYDPSTENYTKRLGKIKSGICSNDVNILNNKGEKMYGLNDGNGFLRKFRFLLEAPFVFFCIPYKLAICCCLDMFYAGKSNEIKLHDHKTGKDIVVGVMTNHVERTNEWQEVIRDGEKINQLKGEEIFLWKQFEVCMPEDADEDARKLIIGALIAEIPSTVNRCAC